MEVAGEQWQGGGARLGWATGLSGYMLHPYSTRRGFKADASPSHGARVSRSQLQLQSPIALELPSFARSVPLPFDYFNLSPDLLRALPLSGTSIAELPRDPPQATRSALSNDL